MSDAALAKKKYILIVHESGNETEYVDNGLYLVCADRSGGWNDLKTRLALGGLSMKGETAPRKEDALLEKLRWKAAELQRTGHQCSIPSCITYTQFIEDFTNANRIPREPDASFSGGDQAPHQPQHVEQAPESLQEEFNDNVEDEIVLPGDEGEDFVLHAEEQDVGHVDLSDQMVPREEYEMVVKKLNTANQKLNTVNEQQKVVMERNAKLENAVSIGQTDQSTAIARSIKGYIENSFKTLSGTIEATVKREVRNAMHDSGTDHLSMIHEKLGSIDSQVNDIDTGVRTVVSGQEANQLAMDLLVQNSKFLRAKATTVVPKTPAPVSKPSSTSSLNDSGFGQPSNWHSTPPPPVRRCNWCGYTGHVWKNCRQRPTNYRCKRCLASDHKDANCIAVTTPCEQCTKIGHAAILHNVTDVSDRCEIMINFGAEPFKHWSNGESPATGRNWNSAPPEKKMKK